jgi:hypothetical protein
MPIPTRSQSSWPKFLQDFQATPVLFHLYQALSSSGYGDLGARYEPLKRHAQRLSRPGMAVWLPNLSKNRPGGATSRWLSAHFSVASVVEKMIKRSKLAERMFKRCIKGVIVTTPIDQQGQVFPYRSKGHVFLYRTITKDPLHLYLMVKVERCDCSIQK